MNSRYTAWDVDYVRTDTNPVGGRVWTTSTLAASEREAADNVSRRLHIEVPGAHFATSNARRVQV